MCSLYANIILSKGLERLRSFVLLGEGGCPETNPLLISRYHYFYFSVCKCSLIIYRNIINFYVYFISCELADFAELTSFSFIDSAGFSTSLITSIPVCMLLLILFALLQLLELNSTMVIKSGESGNPCLILDFKVEVIQSFTIK